MSKESMDVNEKQVSEKDLVERYIYEVVKRIPKKMREEIKMELIGLIEDMKDRGASIEEVLEELGSPSEFAKRYRDENSYVIGPDYYDNYIWILKIGAIAILISALVSGLVNSVIDAESAKDFVKEFMKEGLTVAISGLWSMVGVVTVIFFALERMKVKVDVKPEEKWTLDKLPVLPDEKVRISRVGSIIAIMFYIVSIGIFLYAPQVFSVFEKSENGKGFDVISCMFNLEKWNSIVPFIVIMFAVSICEEIVKIIYGQYCKTVMYTSILSNSIAVVCSTIVLKCTDIWNPNFATDISKKPYSKGDILYYWGTDRFDNIILGLFVLYCCLEVGVIVYNTIKYGEKKI